MARVTGILETALDVDDLGAAIDFYHGQLGLEIIDRNERLCALSVGGSDVLLLFQRELSPKAVELPAGNAAERAVTFAIPTGTR